MKAQQAVAASHASAVLGVGDFFSTPAQFLCRQVLAIASACGAVACSQAGRVQARGAARKGSAGRRAAYATPGSDDSGIDECVARCGCARAHTSRTTAGDRWRRGCAHAPDLADAWLPLSLCAWLWPCGCAVRACVCCGSPPPPVLRYGACHAALVAALDVLAGIAEQDAEALVLAVESAPGFGASGASHAATGARLGDDHHSLFSVLDLVLRNTECPAGRCVGRGASARRLAAGLRALHGVRAWRACSVGSHHGRWWCGRCGAPQARLCTCTRANV